MNAIKKNLIKINYIHYPKFKELSDEKKELLYEKHSLVYKNIPVSEKMFLNRRRHINKGILDLVDKDMANCLNSIFIEYLEGRIDGRSVRYTKDYLYRSFYNFNGYRRDVVPYLVYDSIDSGFYGGYPKKILNDENNKEIFALIQNIRFRVNYRDLKTKDKQMIGFYHDVLKYLVAYFVIHEEITGNMEYFDKVCNFFEDHIDYYYTYCIQNYENNYGKHTYGYIPEDLIYKYEHGIVTREIV